MCLALMSCLSLIPGNHKSWLLVITKHRCSCSTDYGPLSLPDHLSVATSGTWGSAGLPALQTCLTQQGVSASGSHTVQRCLCKFWTPFENFTSIAISKVKYET